MKIFAETDLEVDLATEGKSIQDTEYGIKFPDSTIYWNFDNIDNPEGRIKFIENRNKELKRYNLGVDNPVKFVKRTIRAIFGSIEYIEEEPDNLLSYIKS